MNKLSSMLLLCLLAAGAARAQRWEAGVFGGYPRLSNPPLGSIVTNTEQVDTDTRIERGEYSYGVRLTFNHPGYYGHELGYMNGRARLNSVIRTTDAEDNSVVYERRDRIKIQQVFYNFLFYMMPAGEWIRPFLAVGAQGQRYGAPSFPEWAGGDWSTWGFNWGGGIKFQPFKGGLIRLDVRDYIGGRPYGLQFSQPGAGGGTFHHVEGSVGVSLAFGGKR